MGKIPEKFKETVIFLAEKLKGKQYAFRGTTSLVLRRLDFNVEDIDILTDKRTALDSNSILSDYLVKKVEYKETEKYKSYFGSFNVNGVDVEIIGEWQIRDTKGIWSGEYDASEDEVDEIDFQGKKVRVTKIETELAQYAKIGRWNVFHKIKRDLKKKGRQSDQEKQIPLI